jgi:zinc protease
MRFIVLLALTFCLQAMAVPPRVDLAKLRFKVTKEVLPNGLTILLHEDHSVPTISYHTWFRVGSKNEEPGFTGIAHLFEHMMFKGAKRYTGKEFDQILQSNGVTNNAFTNYDYTGYFEDLPSSKLKLIIDVESDRMVNLVLNEENLKSEREVVKEERRYRVDNSVTGALNEVLWTTAFKVHPYKWPVIGFMDDLNAITLEKCREFYRVNYSVSNAVITIAGDFDSDQAMKWIKEYYGDLPKVEVPRPPIAQEPPQKEERRVKIQKATQTEHLAAAYHIGKTGDDDSFVMDLLSNILAQGESSRLHKKLVYESQLASGVGAASYTPHHPGLFEVFVELKPGTRASQAEVLLNAEIDRVRQDKVSQAELEKAKNQIMKGWVDSMKTIHGKARNLVLNEVLTGSYENLFDDLSRYQKITRDDIQRVARKYLNKTNRTVVTVLPMKESKP